MVYELLQNCFVPYDFASDFDIFFRYVGTMFNGHVPPSISHLFVASQLLALEKQTNNI